MIIYALITELRLNKQPFKTTCVPMKSFSLCNALSILFAFALGGCNRYQVSLNNNEIYSPPPLYAKFELLDDALHTCVQQTIADQRVHNVKQLTALRCSNAGIRSLAGLEHFAWLKRLDLSANSITDGASLRALTRLQYLNITDNPQLDCAELPKADTLNDAEILAPAHCR